jgi:hypothetical protein
MDMLSSGAMTTKIVWPLSDREVERQPAAATVTNSSCGTVQQDVAAAAVPRFPAHDLLRAGKTECLGFEQARFRGRHGVSGAMSDVGHALAGRHGPHRLHQLRPAAGDSPEAEGIKVLARTPQDDDLGADPGRGRRL